MTPDILHSLLGAIKELPPNRWRCSVNAVPKGPVTDHKVGVTGGTTAWTRFGFKVDGADHVLLVQRSVDGQTHIALDGADKADPSLNVHTTTYGISAQLVVTCHFTDADATAEYRFDGRLWP